MNKMPEELEILLTNASKKLDEAQKAKDEVLDYLEENYGLDIEENSQTVEDSLTWCYGLDRNAIEKLIKNKGEKYDN